MLATYTVKVDWDNDGDFSEAIENISAYVFAMSWTRGRDYASELTGKAIAGRATIRLWDIAGRFSSFNAASPLHDLLLPNRKVEISTVYDAATVIQWTGFIDTIRPDPVLGGGNTATIEALGILARLVKKTVNIPLYQNIYTGEAVNLILDDVGTTWRIVDRGYSQMTYWWTGGQTNALTAIRELEESEGGYLHEGKGGKVHWHDRRFRETTEYTVSQATFADHAGHLSYRTIRQEDPMTNIYNRIKVPLRQLSADTAAVLWNYGASTSNTLGIVAATSVSIWAEHDSPVINWVTPDLGVDITANAVPDGSGASLTSSLAVTVSKFDLAMKITITNNHATQMAWITLLRARGISLTETASVYVDVEDTTSIGKYGERIYPVPAQFIFDREMAETYAAYILALYKDPQPILTIGYLADLSDAQMDEAIVRDISERITIDASGPSYLGVNQDFIVESIAHSVDFRRGEHRVEYMCAPVPTIAPSGTVWILGTGTLGTSAVLAGGW